MTKEKNIAELDRLFSEVSEYNSTAYYKELLEFVKKFPKIAPYNAMLIHIQKPGSKYVASASEWKKRFNRKPKPGARPLVILRTFGPVTFVYELRDTEGKDFPQELENPFKANGNISEKQLKDFIDNLHFEGINVRTENYGTERAGQVQVINEKDYYEKKEHKKVSKIHFLVPFAIVINNNDTPTKLATLYHELGHIYCGHLWNPEIEYLPKRYYIPHQVAEFEAESVCWLLCERQGIENPSAKYLSGYLDNNQTIPNISMDTVLKAVAIIERLFEKNLKKPRKELIID